jgi:hypothetical protein
LLEGFFGRSRRWKHMNADNNRSGVLTCWSGACCVGFASGRDCWNKQSL